jgi:hypothetical protein
MREIDLWSVDNFFTRLIAAHDADDLRAVMGLLSAGASGLAGLRSAAILRLGQFIARVINHILLRVIRRQREFETDQVFGNFDERKQQQTFDQPARQHSPVGEHADGRLSG